MKEVWKPVPDTDYEASSYGNIRRIRVLSPTKTKQGYLKVARYKGGQLAHTTVHILVAEAFWGVRPKGKQINHKDGNKCNNRPENLEYVTRQENARHAVKLGLYRKGKTHPRSKLTEAQISALKKKHKTGRYTLSFLAKLWGIHKSTVHKIVTENNYYVPVGS
jgi:hypothetical protein